MVGVRRKHPNILVVIPQIVLGEIMVEMFEKEKLGYIEKMGELIRRLKLFETMALYYQTQNIDKMKDIKNKGAGI